ncbi:hypothetical protein QJS10_CPA01g02847 [Acorus calamus]|uniref:Eukaryotic translation initiation factor 4G n=1 Tax=Acorus calamus TaxID=4465 RepID=A0AAV9FKD0_ACOCL|nr:hypothetical protein QJS10_CPA01g02847 [Acorus calamus]
MATGSQAPIYNYPGSRSGQPVTFINPSVLPPLPSSKPGPPMPGISEPTYLDMKAVSTPSGPAQVTGKLAGGIHTEKILTPSLTVGMPLSKSEPVKLSKPLGDSSHNSNLQRSSKGGGESLIQQGKLLPESSMPVLAKHSTTVPAVVSVQRTNPDICLPVSVNPVEDLVSVGINVEGRRREPVRRSESFKDHPKKPSKKDAQPQPHSQADATESTGGSKLSSIKMPKDNDTAQANAKHVTRSPALMRNSSGDGETSISSVNLPSPREQGDPYAAGTFQPDDVKSVHPPSSPSVVTLEADALGQIQIGHSDSCREVGVACRDVEKVPCQALISTVSVVAETISQDAAASCYPNKDDSSIQEAVVEQEISGTTEQMIAESSDGYVAGPCDSKLHIAPIVSEPSEGVKKVDSIPEMVGGELEKSALVNEFGPAENAQTDAKQEVVRSCSDAVLTSEEAVPSTALSDAEFIPSDDSLSTDIHANKDKVSFAMNSISSTMSIQKEEADFRSSPPFPKKEPTASPLSSVVAQKYEGSGSDLSSGSLVSTSPAGPKPPMDFVRSKSTSGKKKKKKEYLSKADAAGYTSDLYLAYKSPVDKQETVVSIEAADSSTVDAKQVFANDTAEDATVNEEDGKSRSEFDDWEDAADTAKLRTLENGQPFPIAKRHNGYESGGASKKKYSRDFLLKFLEQCTELPVDFDIRSAMEDSLISVQVGAYHNGYPSPGRISDRPSPRVDRRGSGISDDDKWSKGPISFVPMRDPRVEAGYGGPNAGFHSGQGVGHGVLRNPRGQSTNQYNGGIMLGPAQSSMYSGGISRNNMDADRWQRGTAIQRGLIASPLTPLQVMHKAEKKYEVGKVSDEEEAKQRQLKGILNKLTPQNFDKLFEKVKDVNIDNAVTLTGVISQIFDKALTEPTFCEMYADFCCQLASALPDFVEDNEKVTFRRVLLNKCQEEFERGEREEAEANRIEEEGEIKSSVEEREAKKVNARRRMLGNIRLIGELYKKRMLTERIMHECIKKLLGEYPDPDEEDVEALCKLMSTIGEMIDHPKAKDHIDSYFNTMHALSTNQKLSSRVRFMLRDAIDLRKNKWQQRRKVEGPKKIEEVHRDAAHERQLQTSRLARGPSMNSSARRGPPGDYGSRISTVLPSPTSQPVGGFRALSPHVRGQDVRFEDGHLYENKTLSVPLPQRLINEDSITLGPQGGLARGMSMRGQSQMPSVPLAALGPNGYGPQSGWTPYGPKAEPMPKPMPDRSSGTSYDQLNPQAHSTSFDNRDLSNADRAFDRSIASTPPGGRPQGSSLGTQNVLPDTKALSEESLREKSISAIKEFYSAKDEEEVALCIKELNSPGFYASMVSLWVTDSFERKDIERDLLAKLLITLCKSRVSLLRQVQLIQGFESVLSTLEDAINDAPKAAEFLGRIFAKMIIENVITLGEIGKIVREGGEEPGRLLEIGIASDVLGSVLEIIKLEKGETALNEIRASSNLRLEDFRPPHPIKSVKLDAFI